MHLYWELIMLDKWADFEILSKKTFIWGMSIYTKSTFTQWYMIACASIKFFFLFFSIWVFFQNHSRITGLQGKGKCIYPTHYYHFHPLRRHSDISREIIAGSSPLHIGSKQLDLNRERLVSEYNSLTIKLCALKATCAINFGNADF